MFDSTRYFTKTNVTVVDNATAGPDGKSFASTVVWGSADATLVMAAPGSFAAGTYTFSVDIKTTDGATVDVRLGAGGSLSTKTVNGTWATYSFTFTLASPADPALTLRSLNSSTPANLAIDNWRCHAGSSDLGADTLAGHIYFGRSKYDTSRHPTSTSGNIIVQNAQNRYGFCQFADDITLGDYTAIVVGRRAGTPASAGQLALSDAVNPQVWSLPYSSSAGQAFFQYDGASIDTNGTGQKSFWNQNGDWQVITNRYATDEVSIWSEDVKVGYATSAGKSAPIRNLFMHHSATAASSNFAAWDFYAVLIWDVALTDAEIVQAYEYLASVATLDSISLAVQPCITIAEGDSITYGTDTFDGTGGYARRADPLLSPRTSGRIPAVPGSTLADVVAREAENLAILPTQKRGRRYRYSLLIGRNDLLGYSGGEAQYAADVADHLERMRTGGFDDIVLITLLPDDAVGWNTARNAFNDIIRAPGWASSRGIRLCDFAEDPDMGPDAAASDPALYPDTTHPSDAGQAILAIPYAARMNTLGSADINDEEPDAFVSGNWSVADAVSGGTLTVTVSTLPADGGDAITRIDYRVDGGTWTDSGISATGNFNISGLINAQAYDVELRAVNDVGAGAASDIKTATPTSGVFTFTNTEAQNYVAEFAVEPSDGWKEAIDDLVTNLKTGLVNATNVFSKLDYFRIGANVDSDAATIDLIVPTRVATLVNTPTFTAKSGFAGNGTTSYVSEAYTPSTDTVNFTQNSASFGVYIDAGTNSTSFGVAMGANGTSNANGVTLLPRDTSDDISARLNGSSLAAFVGTVGTVYGLTVANRSASNAQQAYKNGVVFGTDNEVSSGLTSRNIYSGCRNNDGVAAGFTNWRIGLVFLGGSLSANENADLDAAWDAYLAAIASL